MVKKAVCLLSGGLDSCVSAFIAKDIGYEIYALSFNYGQKHNKEIECARKIVKYLNAKNHIIFNIDLKKFGRTTLLDNKFDINNKRIDDIGKTIPSTYVPARNTIFLSFAIAWAETLPSYDIFIGVNEIDFSGYPDCRGEFISAFEKTANLATAAAVEGKGEFTIHTPIIGMTKEQIILRGTELGVDYSLTHSCYDPDSSGRSCGRCDSCRLRLKGFSQAGLKDPIEYQK